ncbi:hypothetical protein B0T25DRAFT_12315 [Lasiosphaeria hispida]|uniref:Acetylserotonin methytransferase-like protein n=1 Tax=Lasiosphaeria hispida TaxID=260671 RepID=A0AAJ0MJE3_9PEZI|nr:hypothetical protein B0T25DRAFT_12315 [Lasiosphaeria hispida]
MSVPPPSGGGFSLFPNTSSSPRPPSRNQPTRPRAATPQGRPSVSTEATPPRAGRQTSVRRTSSVREGKQRQQTTSNNPWQHALDARNHPQQHEQQQYEQQQYEQQQYEQQQYEQYQYEQQQHHQQQQQQQQPQQPQLTLDTRVPGQVPAEVFSADTAVTDASHRMIDVPPRCETALSEAQTLVRSPSTRSRSSIRKPPLTYVPGGSSGGNNAYAYGGPSALNLSAAEQQQQQQQQAAAIRSMFPQYNPELPLDRQEYYPMQANPVHLPQSAISRPMYSPRSVDGQRSPGMPVVSPGPPTGSSSQWPGHGPAGSTRNGVSGGRSYEPPSIPDVSTTEELRSLWKVANGWKASSLEGRLFCLKMTSERDAPIYTLTSASSQPFYSLRVDPTSASAYVSLSRYDPNKPFKGPKPSSITSVDTARAGNTPSPSPSTSSPSKAELKEQKHDAKYWQEVLGTQLEEASRKQPPNDGLVAQLWPAAAARLAADRANDAATVALAEHECARLVWDADSGNHFLVHPALAMPFCVTVERNAAFSRTEYTLEHLESPVHLGRLTRDGTGAGWLEVDTSIAAKVDAVYLVDVVVAALVLVAHADTLFTQVEVFEPPPVFGGPDGSLSPSKRDRRSSKGSRTSRLSRASKRDSRREERERQKEIAVAEKNKKPAKSRLEQFEMDLESQASELGKSIDKTREKDKVPGLARGVIAVLTITFKCIIWCFTIVFKALTAMIGGLARCLGSDKF